MKKLILSFALICVMLFSVEAQKGLLSPITVSDIKAVEGIKAGTGAWFLRLNANVAANVIKLKFDEVTGDFLGFESSYLSRAGFGGGFAHYIEVDGVVRNNYSFNALLLMATSGDTNAAVALTASAFNFNIGIGYDIIKDSSFKENLFGMFGVQLVF
jgi:hypothetical protein